MDTKVASGRLSKVTVILGTVFRYGSMSENTPISTSHRPFPDARNHKPPTFSRKIGGLCLLNVAVKERFELSIQFLVYTLSRRAP